MLALNGSKNETREVPDTRAFLRIKLLELLETTSCHGIPNIVRANNFIMKVIWTLVFLAFLAYAIYTAIVLLVNFLQYSVLIKFERTQQYEELDFPSVSVCNLCPFDFSEKSNLEGVFNYYTSTYRQNEFYYVQDKRSMCSNMSKEDIVTSYGSVVNLGSYGFSLEKMVINCLYNNKPCNLTSDFESTTTNTFGKCYIFNSDGSRKVERAGLYHGLQMELFIGENEYQPCWQAQRGMAIAVFPKNYKPFYNDEGLKLQPGVENNLALGKAIYQKLSSPFSNCIADLKNSQDTEWVKYTIKQDGVYSLKRCIRNCAIKLNADNNIKKCATENDTSYACLNNNVNVSDFFKFCPKDCPVECEQTSYSITTLFNAFPSLNYADFMLRNGLLANKFTVNTGSNLTYAVIKENTLKLNVYFKSFDVDYFTEQQETDFNQLLANLGGQLGLFLGISLLTFFEFLDYIFLLIFSILTAVFTHRAKNKNNQAKTEENANSETKSVTGVDS